MRLRFRMQESIVVCVAGSTRSVAQHNRPAPHHSFYRACLPDSEDGGGVGSGRLGVDSALLVLEHLT